MRHAIAAALLSAILPTAAFADANPGEVQSPGGAADSYIVAGFKAPDDWQFIMGPKNAPEMGLKLVKVTPEGSVGFLCRTDGTLNFALSLPNLTVEPGSKRTFTARIGSEELALETEAAQAAPGQQLANVFEASGKAVPKLLDAMGKAPNTALAKLVFSTEGHSVAFALTSPRDIAATAAAVCGGWSDETASAD